MSARRHFRPRRVPHVPVLHVGSCFSHPPPLRAPQPLLFLPKCSAGLSSASFAPRTNLRGQPSSPNSSRQTSALSASLRYPCSFLARRSICRPETLSTRAVYSPPHRSSKARPPATALALFTHLRTLSSSNEPRRQATVHLSERSSQ